MSSSHNWGEASRLNTKKYYNHVILKSTKKLNFYRFYVKEFNYFKGMVYPKMAFWGDFCKSFIVPLIKGSCQLVREVLQWR